MVLDQDTGFPIYSLVSPEVIVAVVVTATPAEVTVVV
jgi:hypothetical protein